MSDLMFDEPEPSPEVIAAGAQAIRKVLGDLPTTALEAAAKAAYSAMTDQWQNELTAEPEF